MSDQPQSVFEMFAGKNPSTTVEIIKAQSEAKEERLKNILVFCIILGCFVIPISVILIGGAVRLVI